MRQLFDYIEGLTLTQGRFEGQPFKLHQWERRFIRGAFGTDGDAGLSVARANGKSTLDAAICCVASARSGGRYILRAREGLQGRG